MDVERNGKVKGSELKGEQDGENEPRQAVTFIRNLQELSQSMETIEQHKVQEDKSETSVTTEKECMCYIHCSLLYTRYYKCY